MRKIQKIILMILLIVLLIPIPMQCGHFFYGCATAPDPQGTYYTYYEIEPLGITLVETLIGANLNIYYWSGRATHSLGN